MILDWRVKGFWQVDPIPAEDFVAAGHSLFDGSFTWPVMVARRSALDHNLATLADFCTRHGFLFAPHGKTTMAPALVRDQLRAGAWAITMATANQALICRNVGDFRLLIANEVLDPVALQWIAGQRDIMFYVDSLAGVAAAAATAGSEPLSVLLELGYPGGRTGCRSLESARAVASVVAASPRLRLAGVAGYEGGFASADDVASYVDFVRSAALSLRDFLGDEPIVSAGGSTYFDVVVAGLGELAGHGFRPVLRSGAYISHDHGFYKDHTPFHRVPHEGSLHPALEIWAQVTSTPEDGLVIVGLGKRDAPIDEGLPVPLRTRTHALEGFEVVKLNDHHAYVTASRSHGLVPGDLICFGISHPCTAFDKWRVIPVVDDGYVVVDLLETYF